MSSRHRSFLFLLFIRGMEGEIPHEIPFGFEVLFKNVSGQNTVNEELSEALLFTFGSTNAFAEVLVLWQHQQLQCNIHRSLLCYTFVVVEPCNIGKLLGHLPIGNTFMAYKQTVVG
ncbi:expressed unknown protein [Seminavis robusta]|uniref:Uncharacterized protein n=1 Tax=Seminavis robusta TaxID=568900 RepID=A0A9N8HDM1_9STRA|nr:expressed unknown protein [Seminavis robusta]|eukprot:Sro265_g102761.1  (116) ;mRNA; f:24676-25023